MSNDKQKLAEDFMLSVLRRAKPLSACPQLEPVFDDLLLEYIRKRLVIYYAEDDAAGSSIRRVFHGG
jgi:hypothetical protein